MVDARVADQGWSATTADPFDIGHRSECTGGPPHGARLESCVTMPMIWMRIHRGTQAITMGDTQFARRSPYRNFYVVTGQ